MYKCIAFDVNGTLIDTESLVLEALQATLRDEGRDMDQKALEFSLGIPAKVTLDKLGFEDKEEAMKRWTGYMRQFQDRVTVFPGVVDTLKDLKQQGMKMGIVTSQTSEQLTETLAYLNLTDYFDIKIGADDVARPKPYPDPLLALIKEAGTQASETLFIGDTLNDQACAQEAHIDFGLAAWGLTRGDIGNYDYLFSSPRDIMKLV